MSDTVEKALDLFGLRGAQHHLVAARENQVFRVDTGGASFALRLHRPGYRSDQQLWSELQWMSAASKGGLQVPTPIASSSGEFLQVVNGIQVDLLSWLSGTPIGAATKDIFVTDRTSLFRSLGQNVARLHQISDAWTLPENFDRPSWDRDGLVGEAPVWDRFWDNPTLTAQDRELFVTFRQTADRELVRLNDQLDYGLIHADLVRENVLIDDGALQFIDFDDGGFGYRLFDVTTILISNFYEPDFRALKQSLLEGYSSERPLDTDALDLFMVLRSATYLGWIIKRMDEPGAVERNERYLNRTRQLAHTYLKQRAAESSPT